MTIDKSSTFFSRSWSVYDLITQHNYMFHREIYAKVAELLKLRSANRTYTLLDLGCGNVRFLAPVLARCPPAYYEGVDLSTDALEEAAHNLEGVCSPHLLRHGDLLEAMTTTDRNWDVVFSGFALHHLVRDQKSALFDAVASHLSEDGWFLLVDVVRDECQSRQEYLDRYVGMMRASWSELLPNQLEQVCAHVAECDYPEDTSTLSEMAKRSGLKSTLVISRFGPHCSILFSRTHQPEAADLSR